MTKIGRNDACPCGSGKKYKHCCLAQANAHEQLLQEQVDAKIRAVEWLTEHYEEAIDEAVMNRFFLDEDDDAPELIAELPEHMQMAVLVCMHEWLIADASLILDEDWVRTSDLLLGPGGPLLTANGRRHIEELAASELSLYEVLEVRKGEGLLLRDMLRPGEKPVFAHEKKQQKRWYPGTLWEPASCAEATPARLGAEFILLSAITPRNLPIPFSKLSGGKPGRSAPGRLPKESLPSPSSAPGWILFWTRPPRPC